MGSPRRASSQIPPLSPSSTFVHEPVTMLKRAAAVIGRAGPAAAARPVQAAGGVERPGAVRQAPAVCGASAPRERAACMVCEGSRLFHQAPPAWREGGKGKAKEVGKGKGKDKADSGGGEPAEPGMQPPAGRPRNMVLCKRLSAQERVKWENYTL